MAQQSASPAPLSPVSEWRSPFGKNHPMAGRIWSTSARRYVTPTALLLRCAKRGLCCWAKITTMRIIIVYKHGS
jgi:hypothetical protein